MPSKIALLVTLQTLAGGSYIDMSWPYRIGFGTLHKHFDQCLIAIDIALDSIHSPVSEEQCQEVAALYQEK